MRLCLKQKNWERNKVKLSTSICILHSYFISDLGLPNRLSPRTKKYMPPSDLNSSLRCNCPGFEIVATICARVYDNSSQVQQINCC